MFSNIIYIGVFSSKLYNSNDPAMNEYVLPMMMEETPEVYNFIRVTMTLYFIQFAAYFIGAGCISNSNYKFFDLFNVLNVMATIMVGIQGIRAVWADPKFEDLMIRD